MKVCEVQSVHVSCVLRTKAAMKSDNASSARTTSDSLVFYFNFGCPTFRKKLLLLPFFLLQTLHLSVKHHMRCWGLGDASSWSDSPPEPLTCGTAASPLQPQSPHPAGRRWPCPNLWYQTPWSGSWVNSPTSPETPLADTECTGWPWEGNKRSRSNCAAPIRKSAWHPFVCKFNAQISWELRNTSTSRILRWPIWLDLKSLRKINKVHLWVCLCGSF